MDFNIYNAMEVPVVKPKFYKIYKGKSGATWIVGQCASPAQNIYKAPPSYQQAPKYDGFRGFGGRTLSFNLEGGSEYSVAGPWQLNASSLYGDTDVDVRNTAITWGCIAMGREGNIYKDVVFIDEFPVMGTDHRIRLMTNVLMRQSNMQLYEYCKNVDGSYDVKSNLWFRADYGEEGLNEEY